MSRHRHFQGRYDDDFFDDGMDDDHDEAYGYGGEEEPPMSPSDREFVFRRERTESGSEVGPSLGLGDFLGKPSVSTVPEEPFPALESESPAAPGPRPETGSRLEATLTELEEERLAEDLSRLPTTSQSEEDSFGPPPGLPAPPGLARPPALLMPPLGMRGSQSSPRLFTAQGASTAPSPGGGFGEAGGLAGPPPKLVLPEPRREGGSSSSSASGQAPPRNRLLDSLGGGPKRQGSPSPSRPLTPSGKPPPRYSGRNSMPVRAAPRQRKASASAGKAVVSLVIVGHVDAGKSTLVGHLLYQLGQVDQRTMHKNRSESAKQGKGSFAFAWVLDESSEERERGVTMDIARAPFETEQRRVTVLDAPGHRDFIPNMISGTAEADAALLVVNATKGEFETGFEAGGQTREHALLARSLGVHQLIVAVNKMDTVGWAQDRFDAVSQGLLPFLRASGFPSVHFVPLSGLEGVNLTKAPADGHPLRTWYDGPSLLQLIDELQPGKRETEVELFVSVSDVYKGVTGGVTVAGKVESGSVEAGERVVVQPSGEVVLIRSLESADKDEEGVVWAGSEVQLSLYGPSFTESSVGPGSVIASSTDSALRPSSRFLANILVFGGKAPMTPGTPCVLHAHNLQETASVARLVGSLGKTGEVRKKRPRCLGRGSRGVVEVRTERPVCLLPQAVSRSLGRLTLRSAGETLASGIVTEIL